MKLTNCRINRETENTFRITRRYGKTPAVDGNITLRNSQLYIDAKQSKASGGETPSVHELRSVAAKQPLYGARLAARGKDIQFLTRTIRWYAGDYVPNVPVRTNDGREEPLTRRGVHEMRAYADIYTGDKVGDAMVHDASFTEVQNHRRLCLVADVV